MMNVHPDDLLLFHEVSKAMKKVAQAYELPLKSITGYPMPASGMADRLGDCSADGHIRLVLRCTVDGAWCDEPCSPEQVWDTAAHELAHLRYLNHGVAFQDFCEELQTAMNNQKVDHRQRVIERLLKMQASRQGEAQLGNAEAAEAFATAINRMMLEYELRPTDLEYAAAADNDPVIEVKVNFGAYNIEQKKTRVAWQETLASHIAKAHLCKILIRVGSNDIYFVGTQSHATVAEYVYGTMVPAVLSMSKKAELDYWRETGRGRGSNNKALGYRAAWIDAFIKRIWERFEEARIQSINEVQDATGTTTETSLLRLDGALTKVAKYIDDKFSTRKAASRAGALNYRSHNHSAGREHGRAAANTITLGRRGMTSAPARKQIT